MAIERTKLRGRVVAMGLKIRLDNRRWLVREARRRRMTITDVLDETIERARVAAVVAPLPKVA